jgi:hypothetical protein
MKANQFRLRPETAARYAAKHEAAKLANAPRKRAWIETEIKEATRDGESPEYIAYLKSKLP